MNKTKVTSKGQVAIPKEVRESMGLRVGDELEFMEEGGVYRLRKHVPTGMLKKYQGYLKDLTGRDPDEIVREMRGE